MAIRTNPAFVAFRERGTNAIPLLLKVLQSGGPRLQRTIMKLNHKQNLVTLPYGQPWHQTTAAAWALYAMGSNASPALPALTNLLFRSNILISTTTAMAGIGVEAIPVLLAALTNRDYRIRHSAASGLGWEQTHLNIVVPALIARLEDTNNLVRSAAAVSLGQLHSEPELTVPALIRYLSSDNSLFRGLILISLRDFGTNARAAVPAIVSALTDQDERVRQNATFALKEIDAEAAAKAGLK